MTIFDQLKDIFTKKDNKQDILNEDNEKEYQPYLINRWISFDSRFCDPINLTVNRFIGALTKLQHYQFLKVLLPKQTTPFFRYIKKKTEKLDKKEEQKRQQQIVYFAEQYELSKREVQNRLQLLEHLSGKA